MNLQDLGGMIFDELMQALVRDDQLKQFRLDSHVDCGVYLCE